jgi:hypothetical protein
MAILAFTDVNQSRGSPVAGSGVGMLKRPDGRDDGIGTIALTVMSITRSRIKRHHRITPAARAKAQTAMAMNLFICILPERSAISAAPTAVFESRLRIDAHNTHSAMRCQEQPQGCKDEKPFHGLPPFAPASNSQVFPPLKVTAITQIADVGRAKPGFYNSVIPVTFARVRP